MSDLRTTIRNRVFRADDNMDKKELVIDLFKLTITGMLEKNIGENRNRIEANFLKMMMAFVINEFVNADLGDYQMSEKQYEDLFNKTIQEILNTVDHHVEDVSTKAGSMSMDRGSFNSNRAYGQRVSPGGIILPAGY